MDSLQLEGVCVCVCGGGLEVGCWAKREIVFKSGLRKEFEDELSLPHPPFFRIQLLLVKLMNHKA